jgi:hypothetical protein
LPQSNAPAVPVFRIVRAVKYLLASLAGAGVEIDQALVEEAVDDRGDEDKWKILDAIGEGRVADALRGIDRYLAAADDPIAARHSFFGILATFARRLTAVAGLARLRGVPRGERNYSRFRDDLAPRLKDPSAGAGKNPLAALHPFPLRSSKLLRRKLNTTQWDKTCSLPMATTLPAYSPSRSTTSTPKMLSCWSRNCLVPSVLLISFTAKRA